MKKNKWLLVIAVPFLAVGIWFYTNKESAETIMKEEEKIKQMESVLQDEAEKIAMQKEQEEVQTEEQNNKLLPEGLDTESTYIVNGEAAYTMQEHYLGYANNKQTYNLNAMTSIFGGNVNEYNTIFKTITFGDDLPPLMIRMNKNEYFIYGEKYKTEANFYEIDGKLYGDFDEIAKTLSITIEKDNKGNIFVTKEKREEFPKDSYVTVLVYHNTVQGKNDSINIDPNRLKTQLQSLKNEGYEFITDAQLLGYINNWKDIPNNSILIHFDDGYKSFYDLAYPVLKELKIPSSMYLLGLTVKERTGDPETYTTPHLSWEQIKEMNEEGLVSFQSHTYNLHTEGTIFKQEHETQEEYEERLNTDFNNMKTLIETRIETPVISMAYPIGMYNEEVDNIAKRHYYMTMTMDHGVEKGLFDAFKIKRIYGNGNDTATTIINRINYY